MGLTSINPTTTKAWKKLQEDYDNIKDNHIKDWFKTDLNRANRLRINWNSFLIDYSKNHLTEDTLRLLIELAKETKLDEAITKMFNGAFINQTEERKVLHTALRAKNKPEEVVITLEKMKSLSNRIINGDWKGYTGKTITDIVNIGIGGSDLGPKMATEALKFYKNNLKTHFISNVDGDESAELLKSLDRERTLIIVVSKSFKTQETLSNAQLFRNWFLKSAEIKDIKKHFIAVTTNIEAANDSGIPEDNILPMWDWVGGRFSMWSAVGLSLCCSIGYDNFSKLLSGAQEMDEHFKTANFEENIPVILGLISIWYTNFFEVESEAILPYSTYLGLFVPYLQQAIMESNGKSISRSGERVNYQTANVIWGSPGTNGQHAFFQLLHQGTKLIPCEFIGFKESLHGNTTNQNQLMANFFGQTEALMRGKTKAEVENELKEIPPQKRSYLTPFKEFEGNRPSTTILIDQLTPKSLGSLIALYEHKIFVQGIIWNIFSFDQWGVEYGKQLANTILNNIEKEDNTNRFEGSTKALLDFYKK